MVLENVWRYIWHDDTIYTHHGSGGSRVDSRSGVSEAKASPKTGDARIVPWKMAEDSNISQPFAASDEGSMPTSSWIQLSQFSYSLFEIVSWAVLCWGRGDSVFWFGSLGSIRQFTLVRWHLYGTVKLLGSRNPEISRVRRLQLLQLLLRQVHP